MLDRETFKNIVRNTPLISLDIVVRNSKNAILLGKRINRPAAGCWFVPGGRILKDESIVDAFARLTEEELRLSLDIEESRFIGPFEHMYPDNFSGDEFSTHYVVLAYEVNIDIELNNLPMQQHEKFRWWNEPELLASDDVHIHTKWYFQEKQVGLD